MSTLPWFAFDLEAYTANTMHLTTEEHGAYLLMMLAYYRTGRPLPAADRALSALTKLPMDRWLDCKDTLSAFFVPEGTHWRHERIESELLVAYSKHTAAVAKAQAAAAAKYGKAAPSTAPSMPQGSSEAPQRRKRTPSKPAASSEHAPSIPEASSSSPHLHKQLTLSSERVNPAPPNDDATKAASQDLKEGQAERTTPSYNPLGAVLPEDWIPGELEISCAHEYGMSSEDIKSELLIFHAMNSANGTFSKNWSATWQIFCARWKERQETKPKKLPPRVDVDFRPGPADWEKALKRWQTNQSNWSRQLGPEPGQPHCRVPPELLAKYHIDPATGSYRKPADPLLTTTED